MDSGLEGELGRDAEWQELGRVAVHDGANVIDRVALVELGVDVTLEEAARRVGADLRLGVSDPVDHYVAGQYEAGRQGSRQQEVRRRMGGVPHRDVAVRIDLRRSAHRLCTVTHNVLVRQDSRGSRELAELRRISDFSRGIGTHHFLAHSVVAVGVRA